MDEYFGLIFWVWVALSVLVGWFWSRTGRSLAAGILVSIILSPLLGILIGLLIGPNQTAIEERELADGEKRKCPFCAELIKAEAIVCRYCGKDVAAPARTSGATEAAPPEPSPVLPLPTKRFWDGAWRYVTSEGFIGAKCASPSDHECSSIDASVRAFTVERTVIQAGAKCPSCGVVADREASSCSRCRSAFYVHRRIETQAAAR